MADYYIQQASSHDNFTDSVPKDIFGLIESYTNRQWMIVNRDQLIKLMKVPESFIHISSIEKFLLWWHYDSPVYFAFDSKILNPNTGNYYNANSIILFLDLLMYDEIFIAESKVSYFTNFFQRVNYTDKQLTQFCQHYHFNDIISINLLVDHLVKILNACSNTLIISTSETERDYGDNALQLVYFDGEKPQLFFVTDQCNICIPKYMYVAIVTYIKQLMIKSE